MSKEITVYWGTPTYPLLMPNIDHAINDLNDLVKDMSKEKPGLSSDIKQCPAAVNHLKNTFRVKFNGNYDFAWTDEGPVSSQKSAEVTDKFLKVRDQKAGLFSLSTLSTVFFTEEPSLLMEVKNAIYARNDFRKYATFLEGVYDVGKWYRQTDLAFYLREKNQIVNIEYGDPVFYVKFLTDYKVRLKKYHFSENLLSMLSNIYSNRSLLSDNMAKSSIKDKLQKYYWAFAETKYKTFILKEIKNNLME